MCDIWIRAWIVVYPWLACLCDALRRALRVVGRAFGMDAQGALGGENRAGCGGRGRGLNEDRTFRLQFRANRAINAGFVACG